jgi:hypothetical protein
MCVCVCVCVCVCTVGLLFMLQAGITSGEQILLKLMPCSLAILHQPLQPQHLVRQALILGEIARVLRPGFHDRRLRLLLGLFGLRHGGGGGLVKVLVFEVEAFLVFERRVEALFRSPYLVLELIRVAFVSSVLERRRTQKFS